MARQTWRLSAESMMNPMSAMLGKAPDKGGAAHKVDATSDESGLTALAGKGLPIRRIKAQIPKDKSLAD